MIPGRTVQISSGYMGVFHQWLAVDKAVKAVIEKDDGSIEIEDPVDVSFVDPVIPLEKQIKEFTIILESQCMYIFAVLENGELWVNKISVSPKIESINWSKIMVPYEV